MGGSRAPVPQVIDHQIRTSNNRMFVTRSPFLISSWFANKAQTQMRMELVVTKAASTPQSFCSGLINNDQ